jgi:hypothetical protein
VGPCGAWGRSPRRPPRPCPRLARDASGPAFGAAARSHRAGEAGWRALGARVCPATRDHGCALSGADSLCAASAWAVWRPCAGEDVLAPASAARVCAVSGMSPVPLGTTDRAGCGPTAAVARDCPVASIWSLLTSAKNCGTKVDVDVRTRAGAPAREPHQMVRTPGPCEGVLTLCS